MSEYSLCRFPFCGIYKHKNHLPGISTSETQIITVGLKSTDAILYPHPLSPYAPVTGAVEWVSLQRKPTAPSEGVSSGGMTCLRKPPCFFWASSQPRWCSHQHGPMRMPVGQVYTHHLPPTGEIVSDCEHLKTAPLWGLSRVRIVIYQQSKLFEPLIFQLLLTHSFSCAAWTPWLRALASQTH